MNEYVEKLKHALKGRVFVYIDAANLESSVRDIWVNAKDIPDLLKKHTAGELCWRMDYDQFHAFFKRMCDIREVKFYSADFQTESHHSFLWFLKKRLGFKLETKPLKEYSDHTPQKPHRKANFDVEIAVDATFKLHDYDTLVLFSGDCDFEYLLKFIRGQNKIAIVFSRTGHVAKELPPASSYYFDIIDFRHDFLRVEKKK